MKRKLNLGFTLVELLVVISIISILTIISVSQFNTAKTKARDTQRKTDIDSVAKALNSYYADYGKFPEPTMVVWGGEFKDENAGAEPYYYMRVVPRENNKTVQHCYLPNASRDQYLLFGNMEGVGATTGGYMACGNSYNFGKAGPNTTIDSFCGGGLCAIIP